MSARPVIPGRIYHVRGAGFDLDIEAANGCDAICIVLARVMP